MARRNAPSTTEPQPVQTSHSLVPATNFDFLDGEWTKRLRAKQTRLIAAAAGAVLVAAAGGLGVVKTLQVHKDQSQLTTLAEHSTQLNEQISQASHVGNLTQDEITAHLQQRTTEVLTAVSSEVDIAKVLANIRANTPNGIELQTITINDSAAATAVQPSPVPGASSAPAAPAPTAGGESISLVVKAGSFSQIVAWMGATKAMDVLRSPQTLWSGTPAGGFTVTTNATLASTVGTARAQELAAELAASPSPSASPTPGGPK